jgi:hypothetical protein
MITLSWRVLMPLSKAQKEIFDKYQVPEDLQESISKELGQDGLPKNTTSRDFLQLLSDKLQEAENLLYTKRKELAFEQQKIKGYNDKPKQLLSLEETIKEQWATATSLWRTADQVVNQSEAEFKVMVSQKHAEYAILRKNLPILELIRWAKPALFTLPASYPALRRVAWALGGIGGALLGLIAGPLGGIRLGLRQNRFGKIAVFGYGMLGIFTGWAIGGVMGARLGLQTGKPLLACSFGAEAAFLNPLNQPRGTQNRHAIELRMEEILYNLAKKNIKHNSSTE